jgi:N-methylhydantoinase B
VTLDSIELEVIKAGLEETALTMENQLFHSGYSPILRESFDGSAAITNRDGGVVVATGIPVHLFSYYYSVQAVLKRAGDRMKPGDSYLLNDPYLGGNLHVSDTAIVTPYFYDDKLAGFCTSMAHKPDVGGIAVGSSSPLAREIYHEGIMFPGVLYWTDEGPSPDIEAMIRSNTRSADEVLGDLRAQVGCTRVGCLRLTELFDRYGFETMVQAFESLPALSESRLRRKLSALPDGTGEGEAQLDNDGVDLTTPVSVRVKVTKRGDAITIDFSGTDVNTTGPVNLRPQASRVGAAIALISLLDPSIPINDGARQVIEFVDPPGLVTHAEKPRPINSYYPTLHLVYCATQLALANLAPEIAIASTGLGIGGVMFGYDHKRNGAPGIQYEVMTTSLGGTPAFDGAFAVMPLAQITPMQPVEILETEYPIEVVRFEPVPDSAGPGRFRGGMGCVREYRLLDNAVFTLRMGQFAHGSWGVAGGQGGGLANAIVNEGDNDEVALPPLHTRHLKAGDRVSVHLSGGGGCGSPFERQPDQVAADVANGLVSPTAAREAYGVVLDAGTGDVDHDATVALRAARGAQPAKA